jgi:uncharacterized protein YndB with AHSA1/START domain
MPPDSTVATPEDAMADIQHEIKANASQSKIYEALTTSQGLRSWWSANAIGDGRTWRFAHTGRPFFVFEIAAQQSPDSVDWRCIDGPNDSVGTIITYRLSEAGQGRTLIEVAHKGWPGTDGNFRKCNTYWGVLLHHLKQYAETGIARPAFD